MDKRMKEYLMLRCPKCTMWSRSVVHMEKHMLDLHDSFTMVPISEWLTLPWGTYSKGYEITLEVTVNRPEAFRYFEGI